MPSENSQNNHARDDDLRDDDRNAAARDASEAGAELEAVSGKIEILLESGQPVDLNEWLGAVPVSKHGELRARIDSLVEKYKDSQRLPLEDSASTTPATKSELQTPNTNSGTQQFALQGRQLGDYRIEKELGRGGMGVVYQARNDRLDEVVALKVLPNADARGLHDFKREFRSLSDISHPNLVGLRRLMTDGSTWFFTMDMVEDARTFRSYVRTDGRLAEQRLRELLPQLIKAIDYLHSQDVIHRDLKPSNVLVDKNGRVVIVDFGLVSDSAQRETDVSRNIAGTLPYIAPEVFAGKQVTPAVDWYALGVMLFECLTGKLPFTGSPAEILSAKQAGLPSDLLDLPDVPEDLKTICGRLLERAPEQRPDPGELLKLFPEEPQSRASNSVEQQLFGRQWQLSALRNQFDRVPLDDKPVLVHVSGRSGEGKSALVDGFLTELRQSQDFVLLAGRCYDRESVPFKALDGLIDALASHMNRMDPVDLALVLPDDIGMLVSLFPVLNRVEVVAKKAQQTAAELDGQQTRKRAFRALGLLLSAISRSTPVIMFIDDLQWGDADSAEACWELFSAAQNSRIFFIGTYRSDEADASEYLQAWKDIQSQNPEFLDEMVIEVGPLTLEACSEMVQKALHVNESTSKRVAQDLLDETDGNAFFVNELLESAGGDVRRIQRVPLRQRIADKLAGLSRDAAELMFTIAVSGQALAASEAISAAEAQDGHGELNRLRNLKLVRLIGDPADLRVDTYHDKIRESLLASMDRDVRKRLHLSLAVLIEENATDLDQELIAKIVSGGREDHPPCARLFDLALHFDAAGQKEKAAKYAFLAAEQARKQFSPTVATVQYERAINNSKQSELGLDRSFRLMLGYAECLIQIGRTQDAFPVADICESVAANNMERASIAATRAEACFAWQREDHDIATSTEHYRTALKELGVWVPGSKLTAMLATTKELVQHAAFTLAGRADCGSKIPTEEQALALRIRHMMVLPPGMSDGPLMGWTVLRNLNVARRYPLSRDLGRTYAVYSVMTSAVGLSRHTVWAVDRGLEIQRELNDEFGIARATSWSGIMRISSAEYTKAESALRDAVKRFKSVGEIWELEMAQLHLAYALYMQGELKEAIQQCYEAFQRAVRYGDMRSNCTLYLLARIAEGRLPIENLISQVTRSSNDILSTCNLHKAEAICSLNRGDFQNSEKMFRMSVNRPIKAMLPNFHAYAGLPYLAKTVRQNLSQSPGDKRLLAKLKKAAWRAAFWCRLIPNEYPFALREYAEAQALLGKPKLAKKYFQKSIRVAETQGAAIEVDASRLSLARLDAELGTGGASQDLEAAEARWNRYQQEIDRTLLDLGIALT